MAHVLKKAVLPRMLSLAKELREDKQRGPGPLVGDGRTDVDLGLDRTSGHSPCPRTCLFASPAHGDLRGLLREAQVSPEVNERDYPRGG
jgi:hypothetical protein